MYLTVYCLTFQASVRLLCQWQELLKE